MEISVLSNIVFILLLVALLNITLGTIVFLRDKKRLSNITFALMSVGVFGWSLGLALFDILSFSNVWSLYAAILLHVSAALIMLFSFYFSFYFSRKKFVHDNIVTAVTICMVILIGITMTPGLVIESVYISNGVKSLHLGPMYGAYAAGLVMTMMLAFNKLFLIYKGAVGKLRQRVQYIFIGLLVAASMGTVTNLIFPYLNIFKYFAVGPMSTAVMVLFIGYAMIRYDMWGIKATLVEMLVGILMVMAFLNIGIDTGYVSGAQMLVFKLLFIPITAVIVIVFIRSFKKEQRQKKKLKKLNKKLNEMDEKKNEFLHIATHQLRGPITAIKGYTSLLREGDYGKIRPEMEAPIDHILSASKVMSETIADYMNIARIEEDDLRQSATKFDLCELVSERAETMRINAEKKNLRFTTNLLTESPCIILADRGNITQVINALLENAIKYTDVGSVTVEAKLVNKDKRVQVSVTDTGIGVAKHEVAGLFDKFTRADNAKESDAFGTGMGLFIAKSLIEANGGSIEVSSKGINRGTTFTIELPRVEG